MDIQFGADDTPVNGITFGEDDKPVQQADSALQHVANSGARGVIESVEGTTGGEIPGVGKAASYLGANKVHDWLKDQGVPVFDTSGPSVSSRMSTGFANDLDNAVPELAAPSDESKTGAFAADVAKGMGHALPAAVIPGVGVVNALGSGVLGGVGRAAAPTGYKDLGELAGNVLWQPGLASRVMNGRPSAPPEPQGPPMPTVSDLTEGLRSGVQDYHTAADQAALRAQGTLAGSTAQDAAQVADTQAGHASKVFKSFLDPSGNLSATQVDRYMSDPGNLRMARGQVDDDFLTHIQQTQKGLSAIHEAQQQVAEATTPQERTLAESRLSDLFDQIKDHFTPTVGGVVKRGLGASIGYGVGSLARDLASPVIDGAIPLGGHITHFLPEAGAFVGMSLQPPIERVARGHLMNPAIGVPMGLDALRYEDGYSEGGEVSEGDSDADDDTPSYPSGEGMTQDQLDAYVRSLKSLGSDEDKGRSYPDDNDHYRRGGCVGLGSYR